MRKRHVLKLSLNRETLRRLSEGQIRDAAGQAIDQSLQYSRCNTCGIACTVITCPLKTCDCES